jgi:signal transduction histidine kinase
MSTHKLEFAVITITLVFLLLVLLITVTIFLHRQKLRRMQNEQDLIRSQHENQLLQSRIEVQEATFSTLGKELHDNIGQLLGTAKMLIGVSRKNLSAATDTIRTADETLGKAIQELRSLSKTLNKEWLEQFNLKQNITTEAERISAAGLAVTVQHAEASIHLTTEEQLILFRIVQEAMQNAVKHAGATGLLVSLQNDVDLLRIQIRDNGKGLISKETPVGVGMLNMRHRVKLLNGNIDWLNETRGTAVIIELPNKPKQL